MDGMGLFIYKHGSTKISLTWISLVFRWFFGWVAATCLPKFAPPKPYYPVKKWDISGKSRSGLYRSFTTFWVRFQQIQICIYVYVYIYIHYKLNLISYHCHITSFHIIYCMLLYWIYWNLIILPPPNPQKITIQPESQGLPKFPRHEATEIASASRSPNLAAMGCTTNATVSTIG